MSCMIRCPVISKKEEDAFARLIRTPEFQELLENDRNCDLVDNYLLSTAFIYLLRAQYSIQQYTHFNLLVALYLAHEVEEENSQIRLELIKNAFPYQRITNAALKLFLSRKEKLWKDLKYCVIVRREESDSIMKHVFRNHYVWRRRRCCKRNVRLYQNQRQQINQRKRMGSVTSIDSFSSNEQ